MSNKAKNKNAVRRTIQMLDGRMGNYGFSQNYGLDAPVDAGGGLGQGTVNYTPGVYTNPAQNTGPVYLPGTGVVGPGVQNGQPTTYSVNPEIQRRTFGRNTFVVTVDVNVVGTGSGNTENPIWLFGGDAYTNTSRPYNQVENAGQVFSLAIVNHKNAIVITYPNAVSPSTNYTTYTISLGTRGEYPFILSSLTGVKEMYVTGIQLQINDVDQLGQLSSEMFTFALDEFGKADVNDLTTPTDLYQQQDNGVFIPYEFWISGREGLQLNILEVDNFQCKYYFSILPGAVRG